jgi:hypothetical protein
MGGAGLLGSVEWVETHRGSCNNTPLPAELHGVSDFDPGGTQDLQTLINDVAKDIQDPKPK